VLILDEATANIDTVTEQLLQQIIESFRRPPRSDHRHRLNTIAGADEIFSSTRRHRARRIQEHALECCSTASAPASTQESRCDVARGGSRHHRHCRGGAVSAAGRHRHSARHPVQQGDEGLPRVGTAHSPSRHSSFIVNDTDVIASTTTSPRRGVVLLDRSKRYRQAGDDGDQYAFHSTRARQPISTEPRHHHGHEFTRQMR